MTLISAVNLVAGLAYGESPRWHHGRLWLCNWGAGEILAVDADGDVEVMAEVDNSIPFSIDWLPDGRLLMVAGRERKLLAQADDGSFEMYADLSPAFPTGGCNEIVVGDGGNVYVNGGGFNLMAGEAFEPGHVAHVSPTGDVRQVAGDIAFGNGMAITPDGGTLLVAESYAARITAFDIGADGGLSGRRVWATMGEAAPDGICLDAEGALWYADVPNRRCVRVAEGGETLDVVEADRGCFACMLGGTDGRMLYIAAAEWRGVDRMFGAERTGQVLAAAAPAAHAGRP
jgi:sugar lactone lactonase YvrE